jgi:hypothetical protein
MMNIVKTDIKNMQDIAPLIDDDIVEIYNLKYRRYKRVKKPNFVNGLTEVKVNPYNNEREYEFASRQGSREASPDNKDNTNGLDMQSPSIPSHHSQEQPHSVPVPVPVPTLLTPITLSQNNQNQSQNQNQRQDINDDNLSVEPVEITDATATNLQLLQMYQQLQAQSQARSQAQSQARPAMVSRPQTPLVQNTIVSSRSPQPEQQPSQPQPQPQPQPQSSVSPATSVRSVASLQLGQIQTDPNGNPGMNI